MMREDMLTVTGRICPAEELHCWACHCVLLCAPSMDTANAAATMLTITKVYCAQDPHDCARSLWHRCTAQETGQHRVMVGQCAPQFWHLRAGVRAKNSATAACSASRVWLVTCPRHAPLFGAASPAPATRCQKSSAPLTVQKTGAYGRLLACSCCRGACSLASHNMPSHSLHELLGPSSIAAVCAADGLQAEPVRRLQSWQDAASSPV